MIFILCLDGATFDLLDPWIEQGYLPELENLIRSGVRSELQSTQPPVTAPAWASFMTGKSPGGHGVFDFFRQAADQIYLVNSTDIRSRLFWDYLGEAELSTGILNLPLTFPVRPLKGYLVPGLLTPDPDKAVYPSDLLDKYRSELGPYRHMPDILYRPGNEVAFRDDLLEVTDSQIRYASHIMKDHPTDVSILHFLSTDIAQHKFWRFTDPHHPWFDPVQSAKFGSTILSIYQRIDSGLRELRESLPSDSHLLVISDHGFGPLHRLVNLNNHLLQAGLLNLINKPSIKFRTWISRNWRLAALAARANRLLGRRHLLDFQDIDWTQSQAFASGHIGQIFIPNGSDLSEEAYGNLLNRLAAALHNLIDPETGKPLPMRIIPAKKANPGPFSNLGPDLLVIFDDYKAIAYPGFAADGRVITEQRHMDSGHHRPNGILIASGPAFKQGHQLSEARLIDLAPTILNMAGVAIPDDMEGKVLADAYQESFVGGNPVRRQSPKRAETTGYDFAGHDRRSLEDRLRALGYLD